MEVFCVFECTLSNCAEKKIFRYDFEVPASFFYKNASELLIVVVMYLKHCRKTLQNILFIAI
jgi:hypothetical protein